MCDLKKDKELAPGVWRGEGRQGKQQASRQEMGKRGGVGGVWRHSRKLRTKAGLTS